MSRNDTTESRVEVTTIVVSEAEAEVLHAAADTLSLLAELLKSKEITERASMVYDITRRVKWAPETPRFSVKA